MLSTEDTPNRMNKRRRDPTHSQEGDDIFESQPNALMSDPEEEEEDAFTQAKSQMARELTKASVSGRFNPHPDEQETAQLRQAYARLLQTVRADRADLLRPDDERLETLLTDANQLLGHVHTTADATLDSRFMALTAELEAERISKLTLGSMDFTISDLCDLVRAALTPKAATTTIIENLVEESITSEVGECDFSNSPNPWKAVENLTLEIWRGVTMPDSMLGALTALIQAEAQTDANIEKTPRQRKPRSRMDVSSAVQPAIITEQDPASLKGSGVETTENVISVFQILQEVSPISFYRLIVDPHSYARTVENLFYVSFLIHDNRIRLEPQGEDDFMIYLMDEQEEGKEAVHEEDGTSLAKRQAILSMSMKQWREFIQRYNLTESTIVL